MQRALALLYTYPGMSHRARQQLQRSCSWRQHTILEHTRQQPVTVPLRLYRTCARMVSAEMSRLSTDVGGVHGSAAAGPMDSSAAREHDAAAHRAVDEAVDELGVGPFTWLVIGVYGFSNTAQSLEFSIATFLSVRAAASPAATAATAVPPPSVHHGSAQTHLRADTRTRRT